MTKKKRLGRTGCLLLILLALLCACFFWSQDFASFSNLDRATEFYIYSTDADAGMTLRDARPKKEDLQPFLDALAEARIKLDGRSRHIQWQREDTLYHIAFYHAGEGVWEEDADFALCTDGHLYVHQGWLGYIRYRLTDCDMAAVDAALAALLGMD